MVHTQGATSCRSSDARGSIFHATKAVATVNTVAGADMRDGANDSEVGRVLENGLLA